MALKYPIVYRPVKAEASGMIVVGRCKVEVLRCVDFSEQSESEMPYDKMVPRVKFSHFSKVGA